MMGLSRYRNSPSCFWDQEIRRRRDRGVFTNKVLQRHKAGYSVVLAKPLLLRALNLQNSTAEKGTSTVSHFEESIDFRSIGLVRAENAALLVKVQRLKDENKQVTQHLKERSSSFGEYKRETASRFLRLVKERDEYKGQVARIQIAKANTQTENAALLVKLDLLEEKNRQLIQQQNEKNSKIQKLVREQYFIAKDMYMYGHMYMSMAMYKQQAAKVQNANANMQAEIASLRVDHEEMENANDQLVSQENNGNAIFINVAENSSRHQDLLLEPLPWLTEITSITPVL